MAQCEQYQWMPVFCHVHKCGSRFMPVSLIGYGARPVPGPPQHATATARVKTDHKAVMLFAYADIATPPRSAEVTAAHPFHRQRDFLP